MCVVSGWRFVQQTVPVSLWSCGWSGETCQWRQCFKVRILSRTFLIVGKIKFTRHWCDLHSFFDLFCRYQATRKRLDSRYVFWKWLLTFTLWSFIIVVSYIELLRSLVSFLGSRAALTHNTCLMTDYPWWALDVNLPVADTIHPQSNKSPMGVKSPRQWLS